MGALITKVASRNLIDPTFGKMMEKELRHVVDPELDKKYSALKVKKSFSGGVRASRVQLLEGDIVRKQYDVKHEAGRRYFWHEVGILHKLKDCPYAPTLLHFDKSTGSIYESYCGGPVNNTIAVQKRIRKQLLEMKTKWGVSHSGTFKPRLGTFRTERRPLNNITTLNDVIYFIDFGSVNFRYQKPLTQSNPT